MLTDVGEYIVGAYLQLILGCDVVDYNVRYPGGGLEGLNELDVIGLRFRDKTAFLCEVTTHLLGMLYKDTEATVQRVIKKHEVQKKFASRRLQLFENKRYMLWSPVVGRGYITRHLDEISDLELVINEKYTSCVDRLREKARKVTKDFGNPFFRALQILEHLRR